MTFVMLLECFDVTNHILFHISAILLNDSIKTYFRSSLHCWYVNTRVFQMVYSLPPVLLTSAFICLYNCPVSDNNMICICLQNAFAVNPTTGVITVNGRLNSQIVEEMAFVVIAEDVDASALGRQQGSSRLPYKSWIVFWSFGPKCMIL